MPKQEEHERLENLVEHHHGGPHTARSLPDAANADNQIEGYAAVNGLNEKDETARIAAEFAQHRDEGQPNDDDWFRAEAEVRRRRDGLTTGSGNDIQEDRSNK
jgi:hypothetical protein